MKIIAKTTREAGYWIPCDEEIEGNEQEIVKECKRRGIHSIALADGRELDVINGFRDHTTYRRR